MGKHQRSCRNILKQYGNNIKAFEERLENPLDDKRNTKTSKIYNIKYEREITLPFYLAKGTNISSYGSLVEFAK